MKNRWLRVAGLGALATGMIFAQAPDQSGQSATTTQQQGQRHSRMARRGHFRQRMANYLNLTPEQRAQAKQIMAAAREQAAPLHQQLKQNRQALRTAIKAGNDAQIDQITAANAPLIAKLSAIRAHAFEKVYANLTPDQKTKADNMRQAFRGSRS